MKPLPYKLKLILYVKTEPNKLKEEYYVKD